MSALTSQPKDVVTLGDALEQIESERLEDRRKGFERLKDILNYNRSHASQQKLTEKSIHTVFEALFRVNSSERASYVRGGKSTTKAASATRLALGASVLRLAVTIFGEQIKRKTVKALLGHIIQILPTTDGGYCEPLALEYLKSLNLIFNYQPHVEHFDHTTWVDIVDFCLDGIKVPEQHNAAIPSGSRPPSFRTQSSAFGKGTRAESIENVVELLGCLRSLVLAPNCPLLERVPIVLPTIVEFLKDSSSITFGHHAALQTINASLARVIFNSSSLVHEIMPVFVSVIKSLWARARAENMLVDELLISLVHLQAFLASVVETIEGNTYLPDMESLLEVMLNEYCAPRKEDRGHLEFSDLGLSINDRPSFETSPMHTSSFFLRRTTAKSERNWAELHFISRFGSWVDRQSSFQSRRGAAEDESSFPTKRRRVTRKLDEILEETAAKGTAVKMYWLQVLAFIAHQHILAEDDVRLLLASLVPYSSHGNSDIASWALLAIVGCAHQPHTKTDDSKAYWEDIWQVSSRLVSSAPVCRAASLALYALLSKSCVEFTEVRESIETMWSSASLSSPALFCDSAVDLCLKVSTLRMLHDPGAAKEVYDQMISWVCAKWSPSNFENKSYSDNFRRDMPPKSILSFFCMAFADSWDVFSPPSFPSLGIVGQAWLESWKSSEVLEYLFLLEPGTLFSQDPPNDSEHSSRPRLIQGREADALHVKMISYFVAEADNISELWESPQNQSAINGNMVHVVFSFCLVGLMVSSLGASRRSPRLSQLVAKLNHIAREVIKFSFQSHVYQRDRVGALFDGIYQFLPPIQNVERLDQVTSMIKPLSMVFVSLAEAINNGDGHLVDTVSTSWFQGDIMDETVHSQSKQAGEDRLDLGQRRTIPAQANPKSFLAAMSSSIILLAHLTQLEEADLSSAYVPAAYMSYVITLPDVEFLLSWPVMKLLLASELQFHPPDAEALFVHLAHSFIAPYRWSRCESALHLCLDAMIGTAILWTDPNEESLAEAAADIYMWLTDVAAGANALSPNVQTRLADLLYKLLDTRPDFAQTISRPSIRTTLFGVLKHGEKQVQYHIVQHLPMVFASFVVNQHVSIFEDIHSSLPNNVDWIEGLAIRLLAHTRLGSSWKSLLRRCLYHIFEIAGEVKAAEPFAISCAARLIKSLGLGSPQELFRLFCPQLLYTWLSTHSLRTIPFKVFAYGSLRELLFESRVEVFSQLIMRGDESELKQLELILGTPALDILQGAFPQAIAYGLAKDVATPSEAGGTTHEAESYIRDLLGKDEYLTRLGRNLHLVVGHLVVRLDKEDQVERIFSKREGYEPPASVYRTIKSISSSEVILLTGQQPDFKPKQVLEAVERACRRVNDAAKKGIGKSNIPRKTALNIWTPTLLVSVSRILLNDIHSVFGPSHACRVVRKLRFLICLAGQTALTGYPLEMLLHSLQPFLTTKSCADDAFGVCQYLLQHGVEALSQNPSFFAGFCLSTFLSLQQFLQSTQDSTTQESDHRATISKANVFHGWLSRFLDNYHTGNLALPSQQVFKITMDIARRIANPVTASNTSPAESQLLVVLLDHLKSREPLLSSKCLEVCFNQIFQTFSAPESFRDDVLGREDDARRYHLAIWKSLQYPNVSRSYKIWAAKILGRAFGRDAELTSDVCAESRFKYLQSSPSDYGRWMPSKMAILSSFVDILNSQCPEVVGLGEHALQECLLCYSSTEEYGMLESCLPPALFVTLSASDYTLSSNTPTRSLQASDINMCFQEMEKQSFHIWIRNLTINIMSLAEDEPLFRPLPGMLHQVDALSEQLFPFILHLTLTRRRDDNDSVRRGLSEGFQHCLHNVKPEVVLHVRAILNAILYIRSQPKPYESTPFERNQWLTLDYKTVASAAASCGMLKTALLCVDVDETMQTRKSKGDAHDQTPSDTALLQSIFSALEEPDSFYGVEQKPDLDSLISRHDFEGSGIQSLLFRSAQLDSISRRGLSDQSTASGKLVQSLAMVNLNSLTRNLAIGQRSLRTNDDVTEGAVNAALKLGQWDIPVPSSNSTGSILYRTFQSINNATNVGGVTRALDAGLLDSLCQFQGFTITNSRSLPSIYVMTSLTETCDLLASRSLAQFDEVTARLKDRSRWMKINRTDVVSPILTSRSAINGIIGKNAWLQSLIQMTPQDSCRIEVDTELRSSLIFRTLGALQESLSIITYLSDQLEPFHKASGVKVDGAVKNEISNVLWERGEFVPSIQILREITSSCNFQDQTLRIGRAETLATLGQRVSHARLEDPGDIVRKYLLPALNELHKDKSGSEVGHVYHEYASYCHNQLISTHNVEEFRRSERFKRQKGAEIQDLKAALSASKSTREKDHAEKAIRVAEKWYDLDKQEYERLRTNREDNLRNSLNGYLRALAASNDFDTDIIKFTALWYDFADSDVANSSVKDIIGKVPSKKFAPLINQLTSRLQESDDEFQTILSSLIERICHDHPYHGMNHIFAGSKTTGGNDSQARSRNRGATAIANKLGSNRRISKLWAAFLRSNDLYTKLAKFKNDDLKRAMSKIALRKVDVSRRVERDIPNMHVPPITMSIDIRDDFDYSMVPIVVGFDPDMQILGGLSAPKLLAAIDSEGRRHKQLFKGGSDDLRQDAIMEQVFGQVTELLRANKATRQRKLRIRTYKVVPFDATSGAIEFVQPTMSLLDFLNPAHTLYHPTELNWKACRDKIERGQNHSQASRIKIFQDVKARFTPVLRHFFFERFQDPDDWFDKRLAYTRSTAAISILGHVLGLGDRHCQNILLDTSTGEVVHIDLGVAFEAGRILPKPETVPFRLTRDIIDGFGILGTEGVFRRCCEFTLEALRSDKDTIITLLNVLRYDPLYSWSVSPLRAKRLQEEQALAAEGSVAMTAKPGTRRSTAMVDAEDAEARVGTPSTRNNGEEGGEADRALSVVERKLAKGLSVTAAVNELIQQATDDRNLAVLFHGWAAYA